MYPMPSFAFSPSALGRIQGYEGNLAREATMADDLAHETNMADALARGTNNEPHLRDRRDVIYSPTNSVSDGLASDDDVSRDFEMSPDRGDQGRRGEEDAESRGKGDHSRSRNPELVVS